MEEEQEIYLVQDDTAGPLDDEINLTEKEKKRIEDIKKKYGIK